jgi:hypothetical protein
LAVSNEFVSQYSCHNGHFRQDGSHTTASAQFQAYQVEYVFKLEGFFQFNDAIDVFIEEYNVIICFEITWDESDEIQ